MSLNFIHSGLTEFETKKHLFNAFIEWLRWQEDNKVSYQNGKFIYPAKKVGEFIVKGMKDNDK